MNKKRDTLPPLDLYGHDENATLEQLMAQRDKISEYLVSAMASKQSLSYQILEQQYKLLEHKIMLASIEQSSLPEEEGVVLTASKNPRIKDAEREEVATKKRRMIKQRSTRKRGRWHED